MSICIFPDDINTWFYEQKIIRKRVKFPRVNFEKHPSFVEWFNDKPYSPNCYYKLYSGSVKVEIPTCPICGKDITEYAVMKNKPCCSRSCGAKFSQPKREQHLKEKYGVCNVFQLESVKEKAKQTNKRLYGSEHASTSPIIREKIKETTQKHYGVDCSLQSPIIKEKCKLTKQERYGDCFFNNPAKINATMRERYGVSWAGEVEEFREKSKQTNMERYGVECIFSSETFKKKIRNSNIERWGVPVAIKNDVIKKRQHDTNLKKYGYATVGKVPEIQEKKKHTVKRTYYPSFLELCKQRNVTLLTSYEDFINGLPLRIKCNLCGREWEVPNSRIPQNKLICVCMSSKLEISILQLLEKLNVTFSKHNRSIIRPQELDFVIPNYHIAIEANGDYWHSVNNKPDIDYHEIKTNTCLDKGYDLIHVFEYEYNNNPDIINDIIISALGYTEQKIYARKCKVVRLSKSEYCEFLKNNNIFGIDAAEQCFGLFYRDVLVEVLGINDNVVSRLCSKIGIRVIGGVSKLLTYCGLKEVYFKVDNARFTNRLFNTLKCEIVGVGTSDYMNFERNTVYNAGVTVYRYEIPKTKTLQTP